MVYINPLGRNWDLTVNWDFLGKLYISFAIGWTIILYGGILWLCHHRKLPYLKIRNIPLAVTATSFLHVYLVKILAAYTINGHFPCSVEFWIMCIYLPFGIALFQANMVQLLSISTQQRRLLDRDSTYNGDFWPQHYGLGIKGLISKWRDLNVLRKAYCLIGIGIFVQVVVTASIFSSSSKLQEHWGTIPRPESQAACRRGIEWIPSALWQLFWSCFYGPYLVYTMKDIKDTHYWRLQTIICVVFGFPGSPMWLTADFSPKFKAINLHWLPPLWLAPGIVVMQAVTVFFPMYEFYILQRHAKETTFISHSSKASTTTSRSSSSAASSGFSSLDVNNFPELPIIPQPLRITNYSIEALEYTLATNPEPLLRFAAMRDFTVESIIFLLTVRNWRAKWTMGPMTPKLRALLFQWAVEIYAQSVSEDFAEFPINISGPMRIELDVVFGSAAKKIATLHSDRSGNVAQMNPSESKIHPINFSRPSTSWNNSVIHFQQGKLVTGYGRGEIADNPSANVNIFEITDLSQIPGSFKMTIFDPAEDSIKYLVAKNTWRKFVRDREEIK